MRRLGLLVVLVLMSSGCVTSGYRRAVSGFATATTGVAEAMQKQISEADVQARERAIWKGYDGFEPGSMATLESPKSADLDARGRLTAEQRAIRRKALSVLKKYSALLKQLAESEVPGQAETASADLLTAVADISVQVGSTITGDDGDAGLAAFAGAANTLFARVLKAALEAAIREALDTAILGGGDAVEALADAIGRDLEALYQDRKAWLGERKLVLNTALQQTVMAARTDPTALLQVIELTERVVAADKAVKAWNRVTPRTAPAALRKAHEKLRAYAEGGHKKEALMEASTAVYALGEATYRLLSALEDSSFVLESPR